MSVLKQIPEPEPFEEFGGRGAFPSWMRVALILAAAVCVAGLSVWWVAELRGRKAEAAERQKPTAEAEKPKTAPLPDLHNPVRPAPASFPPDSNLPRGKEIYASGPIDLKTFSATNMLERLEDARVWFESDNDRPAEEEDDHVIHRAMEVPLKRLINLLEKKGGKLKIHEAYRAVEKNNVHLSTSLHCEGRAVDLTCERLSLSDLAKLAWQSGFDFVLYEKPRKSGVHLHCSVKRGPDEPLPPRPATADNGKKD